MMVNKRKIVACCGSSSTAGKGQAFDWIAELRCRPSNAQVDFLNFGVGGDFACNALNRRPAIIRCRPDKVLVWVGANDALALVSNTFQRIFSLATRLPRAPSIAWYRQNMLGLAERLRKETTAEVGLCSLPPIGEDLDSGDAFQAELNRRIEGLSNIVAGVARETGCRCIPLHERLAAEIRKTPGKVSGFSTVALLLRCVAWACA